MSEEATSQNEVKSPDISNQARENDRARTAAGGSRGLTLLALLIGCAGLGAGGWSYWQTQQLQNDAQSRISELATAQQQIRQIQSEHERQLMTRLDAFPPAEELKARQRVITELQSSQQQLNQQVQKVLGESRQEWRLAEAEYLLRMAGLRLSAQQDVRSGIELIKAADDILRLQDDPAAYAVRQQLAVSLEALRTLPVIDRTGLFMQLGALRDQGAALQTVNPVFKQAPTEATADTSSWKENWISWDYWWEKASRYIRLDFHADQDIRPLLAGEALAQVRLAYCLTMEQAQWAVLDGNQAVYRQAMKQAVEVLENYFNHEQADVQAIKSRLGELAAQRVEMHMPDLTPAIEAMQGYIARREKAVMALPQAEPGKGMQAADAEPELIPPAPVPPLNDQPASSPDDTSGGEEADQ